MKTYLDIMHMYTLLQSTTNLVAHMKNIIIQNLREFVLNKTIIFLDDISMEVIKKKIKDFTLEEDRY